MNINADLSDDDLSSAMGEEPLLAHDLAPGSASSKEPAEPQVHQIGGARYPVVDQSANRRNQSKVSKIWQDGMELRALDSANLDKFWLCNHCLPTTRIYKITSSDGNTNTTAPIRHAFSSAKMLITPERNLLGDNLIEALECLRAWWNNGLIKGPR
jgi:hypothetical protein